MEEKLVTPTDAELKEYEEEIPEEEEQEDVYTSRGSLALPVSEFDEEAETIVHIIRSYIHDKGAGIAAKASFICKDRGIKGVVKKGVYTGELVMQYIGLLREETSLLAPYIEKHTLEGVAALLFKKGIIVAGDENVSTFEKFGLFSIGKKVVVVLGGGFAGVEVAKKLAKRFKLILVNPRTFFEYLPSLPIVTCKPTHLDTVREPFEKFLPSAVHHIVGKCTQMTRLTIGEALPPHSPGELVVVHLDNGSYLTFDYLYICTGSRYDFPLQAVEDGPLMVDPMHGEQIQEACAALEGVENVVVVGGGPTGIEIAGEIMWHCQEKKLTVVTGHNSSLHRAAPLAHKNVDAYFAKFPNVTLKVGDRVSHLEGKELVMQNGERIACEIVYVAVGFTPNSEFLADAFPEVLSPSGHIEVNEHMQMKGFDHIFVMGDVPHIDEEKLAQNALKHALVATANMYAMEKVRGTKKAAKLKTYKTGARFVVVSLGPKNALMIHGTKVWVEGKLISKLKTLVEFKSMIGLSIPATLSL